MVLKLAAKWAVSKCFHSIVVEAAYKDLSESDKASLSEEAPYYSQNCISDDGSEFSNHYCTSIHPVHVSLKQKAGVSDGSCDLYVLGMHNNRRPQRNGIAGLRKPARHDTIKVNNYAHQVGQHRLRWRSLHCHLVYPRWCRITDD